MDSFTTLATPCCVGHLAPSTDNPTYRGLLSRTSTGLAPRERIPQLHNFSEGNGSIMKICSTSAKVSNVAANVKATASNAVTPSATAACQVRTATKPEPTTENGKRAFIVLRRK